jgi:hypothetical protein
MAADAAALQRGGVRGRPADPGRQGPLDALRGTRGGVAPKKLWPSARLVDHAWNQRDIGTCVWPPGPIASASRFTSPVKGV